MEMKTDIRMSSVLRRSFYVKVHLSAYASRGLITPNGYSPPPFGKGDLSKRIPVQSSLSAVTVH
jgi:hypothetical protein